MPMVIGSINEIQSVYFSVSNHIVHIYYNIGVFFASLRYNCYLRTVLKEMCIQCQRHEKC